MPWSNRLDRYRQSFIGDDGDPSLVDYDQELHDDDHEPTTIPSQITKRVRVYAKSLPLCWDKDWAATELEDFGMAVAELARNADEVCLLVDKELGRGIAPSFPALNDDDIHHSGPPLHSDRFLVGDDG